MTSDVSSMDFTTPRTAWLAVAVFAVDLVASAPFDCRVGAAKAAVDAARTPATMTAVSV